MISVLGLIISCFAIQIVDIGLNTLDRGGPGWKTLWFFVPVIGFIILVAKFDEWTETYIHPCGKVKFRARK